MRMKDVTDKLDAGEYLLAKGESPSILVPLIGIIISVIIILIVIKLDGNPLRVYTYAIPGLIIAILTMIGYALFNPGIFNTSKNVFLTNKRVIISHHKKLYSIFHEDVKTIYAGFKGFSFSNTKTKVWYICVHMKDGDEVIIYNLSESSVKKLEKAFRKLKLNT